MLVMLLIFEEKKTSFLQTTQCRFSKIVKFEKVEGKNVSQLYCRYGSNSMADVMASAKNIVRIDLDLQNLLSKNNKIQDKKLLRELGTSTIRLKFSGLTSTANGSIGA